MANLTIRISDSDKDAFTKFCDEVGLTVSAALNVFVRKVVREQRIPFEVETNPFYSEENMSHLRAAYERSKNGEYISFPIVNGEPDYANPIK